MSATNTKFRTFGSGVKIGNWNEDKFLQQKNETEFQAKLNGGELNFQKSDRAIAEVTAGVDLTSSSDGTLHFGDKIMFTQATSNSALASLPSIRPTISVSDSIECTGASTAAPNSRTVFTIVPFNEGNMGNTVTYGDKMYLELSNPLGTNALYLRSLNPTLNVPVARFSGEQKVDFVEIDAAGTPPRDCIWELISSEAKSRPEDEGAPVLSTSNVHIKHAATGQCLACLYNLRKKILSDFGADHEITCKTRVAGKVMGEFVAEDENLWTITMA
eukprot:m.113185 g.113185  ORF g.113185 m.113185 type:complete len:273 (-) comp28253_c0_seq1:21-839(-)